MSRRAQIVCGTAMAMFGLAGITYVGGPLYAIEAVLFAMVTTPLAIWYVRARDRRGKGQASG